MSNSRVDDLPLRNRTVVVAASPEKAETLKDGLERLGATVLQAQVSLIRALEDTASLDAALRSLDQYRWILFTSVHAVRFFCQRLSDLGLAHLRTELQSICAIGPATAARLAGLGFRVSLVPDEFVSEGILRALAEAHGGSEHLQGVRILLPRAREGRELLPRELAAAGALVDVVPCYESVPAQPDEGTMKKIAGRPPDLLVFTSPSNVRNFVDAWGETTGKGLLATSVVAALGPVTAAAVLSCGRKADILPEANTIASLLDAIRRFYGSLRGPSPRW
jgi:uroporphyrinogen III methyltransferase / synthase